MRSSVVAIMIVLVLLSAGIAYLDSILPQSQAVGNQRTSLSILSTLLTDGGLIFLGWLLKFTYDQYFLDRAYSQRISQWMIDRIHQYSEKYYLPLEAITFRLMSSLQATLSESNPTNREHCLKLAFADLIRYLQTEAAMIKATGGIIVLKDFDSEDRLAALHAMAISMLPLDRMELMLLSEIRFETLAEIMSFIEKDEDSYFKRFSDWSEEDTKVKEFIKVFACHNAVLQRGLGMVYRPWYQKSPPKLSKDFETLAKKAQLQMSKVA